MEPSVKYDSQVKQYWNTIKDDINARIAESERQFASGEYMDFDEAMDKIEAELANYSI